MGTMDVPERLQKRPLFRGFVVPRFALIGEDGVPDFKVIDRHFWEKAVRERLCGICGEALDYWIYFIGGPQSISARSFIDLPMHEECARYSMRVCPFLHRESFGYAKYRKQHAGLRELDLVSADRPSKMGLLRTRNYKIAASGDTVYLRAEAAVSVEWWEPGGGAGSTDSPGR